MGFPYKSLRDFIKYLDEQGELHHVKGEVDPKWEMGFIHKQVHLKKGPALIYENIKGFPGWRLVDHVLGTFSRCFAAMNTGKERVFDDYIQRTKELTPPKVVDKAAFREVVLTGEEVDLTKLPVPTWAEHDGGPYITYGVVMVRDPDNGYQNMAIYRMQLKGPKKTGILIHVPQHIAHILAKYEARGEPMPLAVALGVDPLIHLCCEATVPYGVSEMDLWGALAGEPLEVVPCRINELQPPARHRRGWAPHRSGLSETNDLLVPATAEIVLEGFVDPEEREPEGPFGEFTGYYSGVYNMNVFRVERMSMRRDAIYHATSVGRPPTEGILVEGLMKALESVKSLRGSIPQVRAARFLGTSALMCVISLERTGRYPGIAMRVGNSLWTSSAGRSYKNIIVVDDDVDIYNDDDVWWAFSVRYQGDRDTLFVPNVQGLFLDPSERPLVGGEVREVVGSLTCKTVFDCTKPMPPLDEGYRRGVVDQPDEVKERVLARWKELGLP